MKPTSSLIILLSQLKIPIKDIRIIREETGKPSYIHPIRLLRLRYRQEAEFHGPHLEKNEAQSHGS